MLNKILKYKQFLDNYSDCPSSAFKEISGNYSRWVSLDGNENDFKPVNLITEPPQRLLDDSDKLCMGYGLSFFDTPENALNRYRLLYNKQKRDSLKEIFKNDKGTQIAIIKIENDGLGDEPNSTNGHFTFHEYTGIDLANKIESRINIFAEDGTINTIL
ncbi:hypothetical protein SNE26_19480 [Mucilaginibacter sp. cycad4]|uniref:hypothetical protein n=1 Tax=Mucilaginibacter sp. cycad4 TaxID=3342096 RepID=UPI002AAAE605|nr:hypothetical protein [Mucilaginibacter gossypii]WPU98208.1 hypothetical protein SNE26_19480 [Mucilaginibacter gossypii]